MREGGSVLKMPLAATCRALSISANSGHLLLLNIGLAPSYARLHGTTQNFQSVSDAFPVAIISLTEMRCREDCSILSGRCNSRLNRHAS